MFTIDRDGRISGHLTAHIGRLESLLADLERFSIGQMPTEAEIAAAPLLDPVIVAARPIPCLTGGNGGHPYVRGPLVHTSPLIVMASDLGWARTYSRLYRLGDLLDVGPKAEQSS